MLTRQQENRENGGLEEGWVVRGGGMDADKQDNFRCEKFLIEGKEIMDVHAQCLAHNAPSEVG